MFGCPIPTFNVNGNNGNEFATAALLNNQNNNPWSMMPWLVFAWLFRGNGFGCNNGEYCNGNMQSAYNAAIAGQALTANQVDAVRNEVGRILSEVQCNSQTGREILQSINQFASTQGLANCATREAVMNAAQQIQSQMCCNAQALTAAINGVSSKICDSTFALDKSITQSAFATERGFCNLGQQLASCCCDLKSGLLTFQNNVNNGFSQIGFQSQTNTANIVQAIKDEGNATRALLTQYHCEDQQAQLQRENQGLRDRLAQNSLDAVAQAIVTNNNNQTSNVTAQLLAISNAIARIPTTTTPATTTPAAAA